MPPLPPSKTRAAATAGWLPLAVGGLLSVGGGLSLLGDAAARKARPAAAVGDWFWRGTLALALVNAGLCLVVEAGKRGPRSAG